MNIRTVRHRGIRRLIEDDDPREIRSDLVNRIRNVLTALISAEGMDGVKGPPGWRITSFAGTAPEHGAYPFPETGRVTLEIETGEVVNLDLEDYH